MAGKTLPQQLAIGSSYTFINSSQDPNKNVEDALLNSVATSISIYSGGKINHMLAEKGVDKVPRQILSESTVKEIEYNLFGNGESYEE